MKRALIISAAAHLTILIVLWQVSLTLSRPITRGYPRLMTAKLVVKAAAGGVSKQATPEPAAAVEATPKPEPPPKPVAETKEPAKVVVPVKPQKKMLPASKQNVQQSSGAASSHGSAAVKSTGGGGVTSPISGNTLKIDEADFPFPYYGLSVQNRIESNWRAPFSGQGRHEAIVYFKISRSGEIQDVKIEQSSGSVAFDQAAMRAVYYANPLPPLPQGYSEQTLVVRYEFAAN